MSEWIPVRDALPEDEEWVQVQTQDGTVYPACYKKNTWSPLFRGGLVEQLLHGKVAYWQPRAIGFPYVQCKCGKFFLQAEGRKMCPVCSAFGIEEKPKKKKEKPVEEVPFTEPTPPAEDLSDMLI